MTTPEYIKCEYCKGVTANDSRGNCCSCNAPRENKNIHPTHDYENRICYSTGIMSPMYSSMRGAGGIISNSRYE